MNQPEINVISAEPDGDYRLRVRFDDGVVQTIDFLPFLSRSRHPDIRSFLDLERFGSFRVDHGDLVWGDYDLCFPMLDLYYDRIMRTTLEEAVV